MTTDSLITDLAARQHGVVSRIQLVQAGIGRCAVSRRVRRGILARRHPGVYQVGPVHAPLAREFAAVLACGGDRVVLSHGTAGRLWQLPSLTVSHGEVATIDVTVWGRDRGRRLAGVRVHRVRVMDSAEVTVHCGVPVTTPARTLLDVAGRLAPAELERAVAVAEREELVRLPELRLLVTRHPRHRGARALRILLEIHGRPALTRSEAEALLLELVRAAGLPVPETNVRVRGFEVDFFWPSQRFIVEVDGYAFHASRSAYQQDRRRDAALHAAGMRVMRVTWQQIRDDGLRLVAQIAQALVQ